MTIASPRFSLEMWMWPRSGSFMAAAAWWLTALALRPLQRVAEGVRQRDEQSLEALPAAGLPDEVSPLVSALNALLQRLGRSLDTQRAFVADAAHGILTRDSRACTGNFFLDEEVLAAEGVTDLSGYAVEPGAPLLPDLFLG